MLCECSDVIRSYKSIFYSVVNIFPESRAGIELCKIFKHRIVEETRESLCNDLCDGDVLEDDT